MKKILVGALLVFTSISTHAREGYFAGELLLGSTIQEVPAGDGDDMSFGLRGVYNINANAGIEFSYQDYGEAEYSYVIGLNDTANAKLTTDSFNLGVKGVLPLRGRFSLSARLGIAFWNTEVDTIQSSSPDERFNGSDTGRNLYFGFGGQYAANETFNIGLEYTLLGFSLNPDGDFTGQSADAELSTLALILGFNF